MRIGSKLLVRFTEDGKFAMDYESGDLDRPSAAIGTYTLQGNMVRFENDGPGFCVTGTTWAWDVKVVEEELYVERVEGGCTIATGTLWRLTPRLVQPEEGLAKHRLCRRVALLAPMRRPSALPHEVLRTSRGPRESRR